MRLELKTQTRVFAIELPDHHYEMVVSAFQSRMDGEVTDQEELIYGIHAMLSDHYEKEIHNGLENSIVCCYDLPW